MKRWYHPAFETDLIAAARYIEQRRGGFGAKFLDDVEDAVDRIMKSPAAWRSWHHDIRRFVLTRFRYTIRYRIPRDENLVEFLSVMHTSRAPETGLDR